MYLVVGGSGSDALGDPNNNSGLISGESGDKEGLASDIPSAEQNVDAVGIKLAVVLFSYISPH